MDSGLLTCAVQEAAPDREAAGTTNRFAPPPLEFLLSSEDLGRLHEIALRQGFSAQNPDILHRYLHGEFAETA